MKEAVIVDAVRTPMGRHGGILKSIRPDDLAAFLITKLLQKTGTRGEEGEDVFIAGGVETMTRGPWVMGKSETAFQRGDVTVYDSSLGWRFPNLRLGELYPLINNGETAENVAEKYRISRKDQDELALESHRRAARATEE